MRYLLYFLLLIIPVLANATHTINLQDGKEGYTDFTLSYLETRPDTPFKDILTMTFKQQTLNAFALGYKKNAVWFRFDIENHTLSSREMVLELTEMFHKNVEIYCLTNGTLKHDKSGLSIPLEQRSIQEVNPAFLIQFAPMTTKQVFVKVLSDYSMFGALELHSPELFYKKTRIENYKYTFYFGAVLVIAFYNLFIYLYLREKLYLYYLLYVFSFAIWISLYRGYAFYFIDHNLYNILQIIIPFFFILLILFSHLVLKTKELLPKIHIVFKFFTYLFISSMILMTFHLQDGYYFMNLTAVLLLPILMFTSLIVIHKGEKPARIYLLALAIFFIGMAMFTLLALGEYPYSNIIRNIPAIGSFFEIILFSLLLAYRINTLKEQKLASQEKLLEQQRTESSRLFHTIAEKTKKLKSMNQRLQQELKKSKELENELMHQATTDPLTGLLNRRAFFDACTREIEEVHRHGNALSVLILDIDKFKDVNDTYGHDAGDIVIKHIAEKMVENTRTIDYVGRIGGEEFAVLMPSTDIENAFEIADRLRSKISRDAIDISKFTIKVSVSIGVSEMKNTKTDIREMMKNADHALYNAKRNGRNRVCKKGC